MPRHRALIAMRWHHRDGSEGLGWLIFFGVILLVILLGIVGNCIQYYSMTPAERKAKAIILEQRDELWREQQIHLRWPLTQPADYQEKEKK